jgi:acetyltransferase-like isoleucine patch superfamily enzyme
VAGHDVVFHGKFSLTFAHRYCARPKLVIGDRTGIGHDCTIIVAKSVEIGNDCRISTGVLIFDSSGHATEPQRRRRGDAPADRDVRPVKIGDNVWIGQRAIIFPGVHIGDNSVVTAGSVVTSSVPANVVVAGYPARQITKFVTDENTSSREPADAELNRQS